MLEKPQSKGEVAIKESKERNGVVCYRNRRPIRLHLRFVCSMLMYISNTDYVHNFQEYKMGYKTIFEGALLFL